MVYKKKIKVAILLDKTNPWLTNYLSFKYLKLNKRFYYFKFFFNSLEIKNYDIVFILGYTKILPEKFLKKNKLNLIIHESKLPQNRGFSPVQWQILKNKKNLAVSLLKAEKRVDSGNIILTSKLRFNGTELYEEIREKQANSTIFLIKQFLKFYPKYKEKKQNKFNSSFNRKRNKNDSRLDIKKSIQKQFNILRVSNNEEWPAHFYYKKNKYILKIFKSKPNLNSEK